MLLIISSNKDDFILFFKILMSLESYNILAVLATILSSIENEHACIISDFKGNVFNVPRCKMMFIVELSLGEIFFLFGDV